ncbi:MAG: hypothetical protein WD426_13900 [Anditalea sp.]
MPLRTISSADGQKIFNISDIALIYERPVKLKRSFSTQRGPFKESSCSYEKLGILFGLRWKLEDRRPKSGSDSGQVVRCRKYKWNGISALSTSSRMTMWLKPQDMLVHYPLAEANGNNRE